MSKIYIARFDTIIELVDNEGKAFVDKESWNEAIEAAAKESESKSHILLPLEARIRKLKK